MKTNELRQIIKEELESVLITEAFKSNFLRKLLTQTSGGKWFLNSLKKAFVNKGYDLANYEDKYVSKYNGSPKSLKKQKGIYVILVKGTPDPQTYLSGQGRYAYTRELKAGQVLGMTVDGKLAYVTRDGLGPKIKRSYGYTSSDKVGVDAPGMRSLKAYDDFATEIYKLEKPEDQARDMAAKRDLRKKYKLGATAFASDKEFKQVNMKKYQAILRNKAAKTTSEFPKLIAECMKLANDAITKAYANPTPGRYGDMTATLAGKDTFVGDISYAMGQLHKGFAEFVSYENEYEKQKADGYDGGYYRDRLKQQALELKKSIDAFKKGQIR